MLHTVGLVYMPVLQASIAIYFPYTTSGITMFSRYKLTGR